MNGELSNPEGVKRLARRAKGIFCADGGARHAARLGLEPAFIVGDMDSLPPLPASWRRTTYLCDFDENRCDFEKALRFAVTSGVRRLCVAGALGGRLDHALVNFKLAERYGRDLELTLVGDQTASLIGPSRLILRLKAGETLSLLAATARARVSLSGVKYPLRRTILSPGSRGVSNQALGAVRLEVYAGRVWVIV